MGMCRLYCSYVEVQSPEDDRQGLYTDMNVVWTLLLSLHRIQAHRPSFLESLPDSFNLENSIVLVMIDIPPGCLAEVMSCSLILKLNTDLIPWS